MAHKGTNLASKGKYSRTLTGRLRSWAWASSNHYSLGRPVEIASFSVCEFHKKKILNCLRSASHSSNANLFKFVNKLNVSEKTCLTSNDYIAGNGSF